jgi:hypothetical protein
MQQQLPECRSPPLHAPAFIKGGVLRTRPQSQLESFDREILVDPALTHRLVHRRMTDAKSGAGDLTGICPDQPPLSASTWFSISPRPLPQRNAALALCL